MAIITEHFEIDGADFIRTYSDANRYVVGGFPYGEYTEACDPAEYNRTYIEGGIITDNDSEEADYAEAGRILLGVSE